LVKIESIAINPYETYLRSGMNTKLVLPWTPGQDAAGAVVAVGDELKVG